MYDNNHQQSSVLIAVEHNVIYYSTLYIHNCMPNTILSASVVQIIVYA